MLGLPSSPGLLDVLEERADMSDVLLRTNIDKLTILPSGTPHQRARPNCWPAMRCATCWTTWPGAIPTGSSSLIPRRCC